MLYLFNGGTQKPANVLEFSIKQAFLSSMEQPLASGTAKGLFCWSGRPGSNRRRPAWESPRRLIIKDLGVQEGGFRSNVFNNLRTSSGQSPLIGVKMEWKILGVKWSESRDWRPSDDPCRPASPRVSCHKAHRYDRI